MTKKLAFVSALIFISLTGFTQKSSYSISDVYKIRQEIDPSGLAYLTTPLQRKENIETIQDGKLLLIVAYSDHMAVLNKKTQEWTVFSFANGYPFVHAPLRIKDDYENKFVLAGSSGINADTTDYVIVFDKITGTVSTLERNEYRSVSSKWKRENYQNKNERWYIENNDYRTITCHDLKTNRKISFGVSDWQIGTIVDIQKLGSRLFVAYKNGIAVHDDDPAKKILYKFPLPSILEFVFHGNEFLVQYDSAAEIFDSNLNSLQYFRLPGTTVNTGPAAFDDNYLFYASEQTLKVKSRRTLKDTLSFPLSAGINGIKRFSNKVLVFISGGHALLSTDNFQINKYLLGDDYGWIGLLNERLIGYHMEDGGVIIFSLDGTVHQTLAPGMFMNSLAGFSGSHFLTMNEKKYTVHEVTEDYSASRLFEFELKDEQVPNAFQDKPDYPVGSKVISFHWRKGMLSIATDKGLFIYHPLQKKWRSHFLPGSKLHVANGLLVRDKVIYSFGESFGAGHVTRVDRRDYSFVDYSAQFDGAYARSIKIKGDELICTNPGGIVHFDFKTGKKKIIQLTESVGQVAFYGDNYLAANDSSVFLTGKKGEVLKRWKLSDPLTSDRIPSPKLIEPDGDNLWINSENGKLSLFSLKQNEQRTFFFPYTGDGIFRNIIPGNDYTWIFGSEQLYRYNKKTAALSRLGVIRYPLKENPYNLAYIRDVLDGDSVFYMATYSGVFKLTKNSLSIRRSNLPYLERDLVNLAKDRDVYFISTYNGIFQIDAKTFESSFTGKPISIFNSDHDAGILLPWSTDKTIKIADRSQNQLFYFMLEAELTNHVALGDKLHPEKYLAFRLNGFDVKLRIPTLNQRDPIKTVFYLSLPPKLLLKGSNMLQVIDLSRKNLVLKAWELISD